MQKGNNVMGKQPFGSKAVLTYGKCEKGDNLLSLASVQDLVEELPLCIKDRF